MEKIIITTKKTKNQDGKYSIDEPKKSTFNKFSFIEYLKNIKLPKKYIQEVEEL